MVRVFMKKKWHRSSAAPSTVRKYTGDARAFATLTADLHELDELKASGSDDEHRDALIYLARKVLSMPGLSKELHEKLRAVYREGKLRWSKTFATGGAGPRP